MLALTRDVNFDKQSSDISAEEIREVILVPDGLRKETTFTCICFYISRGYFKCHGMLISATPSLGDNAPININTQRGGGLIPRGN